MSSESNLEVVHDDGTVTSKLDDVTRSYADHVAFCRGPSPLVAFTGEGVPAPTASTSGPRASKGLRAAAALGALSGGAVVAAVHFIRW